MRVKIYQINMDRDSENVKFMGTDARKSLHLKEAVDPSIYDEVFNAEIKETEPEDITDEEVQRDTGFAFFFGM